MSNVVGLHDAEAERIARREMPSLSEARDLMRGVTREHITEIAKRGFRNPESLSPHEVRLLIADRRISFERSTL